MASEHSVLLRDLALKAAPDAGKDWLRRQFEGARSADAAKKVTVAFAGGGRRLGSARIHVSDAEAKGLPISPAGWTADDAGRVALLLAALEVVSPSEHVSLVEDLYYRGELGEKRAVLRALPLLDNPERYRDLAIEACRTNVVDLFSALAQGNPFPTQHFEESSFNQLLMKALFLGVSVRRVWRVESRITLDLKRMLADYKSERVAAGRSIPADLTWLEGLDQSLNS